MNNNSTYPASILIGLSMQYSVYELYRKFKDKRLILDSDFQREYCWTIKQQSELIESILMGLPLPIFYFNETDERNIIVVDGRQRLTTIFNFIDNKFELKNLLVLKEINGNFEQLEAKYQRKIEDYNILAHVIPTNLDDRIMYDIFDRVNRGGTKLNDQEIRNALKQGNATELLKQLALSEEFSNATGDFFKDEKRMIDRKFILRFISVLLREVLHLSSTYKSINTSLDETMDMLNEMPKDMIEKIVAVTKKALNNSYQYLGKNAFRMKNESRTLNMQVFDSIMFLMSQICYAEENKDNVKKNYSKLMNDEEFIDTCKNYRDTKKKYLIRISILKDYLEEIKC